MNQLKKITEQNGITLISLVITVVILLILAGVAVSITVNENGLFEHAQNATGMWNGKVAEEETEIGEALEKLETYFPTVAEISTEVPEEWKQNVQAVAIEGEKEAPIPKGYTVSEIPKEKTISKGLVIYQIPANATVDWGNNKITLSGASEAVNLQEAVNQYVWIPVDDINDMVMCKHNNITEGSYEENGETITTKACKLEYDVSTDQITCKTHNYSTATALTDSTIDTIGLAGRLYSGSISDGITNPRTTTMDFSEEKKAQQVFIHPTRGPMVKREPSLVQTHDKDDVTSDGNEDNDYMEIAGVGSSKELNYQLNNKFIEIAKSVAKYGGFYISRYEIGENAASKKNQKVLVAGREHDVGSNTATLLPGNTWYGLYNKILNSTENSESVNSHMIWRLPMGSRNKIYRRRGGEST